MPQIIQIPRPCHEDWLAMTPNEQGRYCGQCEKTVVDFTSWAPAEIIFYLKMNAGACGRFRTDQLNSPIPSPEDFVQEIVRLPIPFMKRVAAIFLFVFGLMAGTSCNEPVINKAGTQQLQQTKQDTTDSTGMLSNVLGGISMPDTVPPSANHKAASIPEPPVLQGEPAMIEPQMTAGAPMMIEVPDSAVIVQDTLKK